ncbi:SulP family inorganic anion transporter [Psychroflexus lacisalsi]|jgi:MFS superfamily sulfate permease-like transporter|uniref:SulP family inorganic anion transporter n=1 Tax=Psychroflexus lacisalsi TaxID=503928 RepID=A0ABN1K4B3_9FLAO|nr:SulP family inorganic anion transporter [Psychroflexus lacisalsi]MBZ9618798.1 SulP family inorganic anion transporter [Psychroflexus lacisalsi]
MFKYLNKDLPASVVVFFVALPLCLGIALASGAPLFSGLIAGIVGGIVVGSLSGSSLGVSGPAAGLAVIVLSAIASLGKYEYFLVAVVIGGALQILLGLLKAGVIGYYFPSSVIKGMLAGIGIIIFLKQFSVAFGLSDDYEFFHYNIGTMLNNIVIAWENLSFGTLAITIISIGIMIFWSSVLEKKHQIFKIIPGPLVAVLVGVFYKLFIDDSSLLGISDSNLVSVPVPDNLSDFLNQFTFPDFSIITSTEVWVVGFTIAVVASLETLLSVEATDKLDPRKRVTPTNRELLAQGTGNMLSGFIGGLPITQVIVRSSANIQSGGRTKMSAILHAIWLLLAVVFIPDLLNLIPLAVLAGVLFIVGFKLAKPSLFVSMFKLGKKQYLPFIVTVLGIVLSDLLTGIGLGLLVGLTIVLINSFKNSHFLHTKEDEKGEDKFIKMTLAEEVTFFNKGAILNSLNNIEPNTNLEIDIRKSQFLDYDILEILQDFAIKAKNNNIEITIISDLGEFKNPSSYSKFFNINSEY